MNKNKIFSISVSLLAIGVLLFSCGKKPGSGEKPIIRVSQKNCDVQISEVKRLSQPSAVVFDKTDTALQAHCTIKSVIGTKETEEPDWKTTVSKIYAPMDKIIVTFTAKNSLGKEADPVVITYTIVVDIHSGGTTSADEKPVITVNTESQNVKVSEVKNLSAPQATVHDDKDTDLKAKCEIKSVIGTKETEEPDWETAVSKIYAPMDKIIVTFTAKDSDGNYAIGHTITYTVIADSISGVKVKLSCIGLETITEKTGSLKFYIAEAIFDQYGNPSFVPNTDEYNPDNEVPQGSYIYIKGLVKKGQIIDGEGSITIQFDSPCDAWKGWGAAHFSSADNSIPTGLSLKPLVMKGQAGTNPSIVDKEYWVAIKLDKNLSLTITAKEPL